MEESNRPTPGVCQLDGALSSIPSNPYVQQSDVGDLTTIKGGHQEEIPGDSPAQFSHGAKVHVDTAPIQTFFEAQADSTPDSISIIFNSDFITYHQLNRKANQLARYLLAKGVVPDQLIGIYVDRSIDMVIGILGILKSGAAYVPLDPGYPEQILSYMIGDAEPRIVLTQEKLMRRMPESDADFICLDGQLDDLDREPSDNLPDRLVGVSARNLAYVIYTSGSTGKPKGVMIEHRNLSNLWRALESGIHQQTPRGARVGVNASYAFDASVKQIVQILSGRTLCIIPESTRQSTAEFLSFLSRQQLDCLDCTPTQLKALISAGMLTATRDAPRVILVGGEAIDSVLWNSIASSDNILFYNVYGPTECAVDATVARVKDSPQVPLIGRPIANVFIHLLGNDYQPVAIDAIGEIFIAGSGVGRGYWKKPELTAERFLPGVADEKGVAATMYRTGDLGRWRSDGTIEYVGRNDNQVKIRGHRVELGEIEANFLMSPGIKEAVVVVREDAPGESTLVGYVVADTTHLKQQWRQTSDVAEPELVIQWKQIHDETYSNADPCPSFIGWNSSFDGLPIPNEQMMDWLDGTLYRIRSLAPRRVLEIGCGTGLLLEQLAPGCDVYRGIDFSREAIERLRAWRATRPDLQHVELEQCSALEFEATLPATYDTVIINSVIQYFPDISYLETVLERAATQVKPGGRIFLGDIRHFSLIRVFHSSVQVSRGTPELSVKQLRTLIRRAIDREKELLVGPMYFEQLRGRIPSISAIRTFLKRGYSNSEMIRYRYDVILDFERQPAMSPPERIVWDTATGIGAVAAIVRRRPRSVRIVGIPNRRLTKDVLAANLVASSEEALTLGDLRQILEAADVSGEEPETLCRYGEERGYRATASFTPDYDDGRFDIEWSDLTSTEAGHDQTFTQCKHPEVEPAQKDGAEAATLCDPCYANDPLDDNLRQQLVCQLRESLKKSLPQHMVPVAIILLDKFPLTANQKVDRRALPAPDLEAYSSRPYAPPQGKIEEALAAIWEEILNISRVGRDDNFFELGGHSLLGMKLLLRVTESLRIQPGSLTIFQCPTVREMSQIVERLLPTDLAISSMPISSGIHEGFL